MIFNVLIIVHVLIIFHVLWQALATTLILKLYNFILSFITYETLLCLNNNSFSRLQGVHDYAYKRQVLIHEVKSSQLRLRSACHLAIAFIKSDTPLSCSMDREDSLTLV